MTAPQATTAASSAQASQAGLALVFTREVAQVWPQLDQHALQSSLPRFKAIMAQLVQKYGVASSTLAARFYQQQRQAAGIPGRFTVRPADPAPLKQIASTVDWATKGLWGSNPDLQAGLTNLTGATETLVLDQGRDTIVNATKVDRKAIGWARIPEPGACAFCAMLATRGAVYKQDTVAFKSHDHCRCHAEPVFTAYEPTAQIREWQALYAKSTKGQSDQLNAFRRAYEGR